MKTNHTPGPWKYIPEYDSIVTPENHSTICKIAFGEDRAEESANARLIAAAPELLAALQFVLSQLAPPDAVGAQCKLYSDCLAPDSDDQTVVEYLRQTITRANE